MLIFPKMLRQASAPAEAEPAPEADVEANDSGKLPDTWRVVLEDGSTSDPVSAGATTGAGQKLLSEVTDALHGRADRKRPGGPKRSVAMPSVPRQSLHALDATLAPKKTSRSAMAPSSCKAPQIPTPSSPDNAAAGARRAAGSAVSRDPAGILAARGSAARRDLDARLARVVDAWPRLPRGVQAAILALIDAELAPTP
ncbi:MAG: hypothetical protein ACOCWL_01075 [Thermoguttaceae bacterium]